MTRDSTIKKIDSTHSPKGPGGQLYLASGKRVAMRLWKEEPTHKKGESPARDYETVGYVIEGRAELALEGQKIRLEPGDSWLVPAGVPHTYEILEAFTAVEATTPPSQIAGRDD